MSDAVTAYAAFFESLTPERLPELADYFAPDARFRDPFNDVRGLAAIEAVFRHMYEQCDDVRVVVEEVVAGEGVAYLRWRFHFRLRGERADRRPIDGVSRVAFDADGRVTEHLDYWDAAGELYSQFPVLGALMRWLRRRLAAPPVR